MPWFTSSVPRMRAGRRRAVLRVSGDQRRRVHPFPVERGAGGSAPSFSSASDTMSQARHPRIAERHVLAVDFVRDRVPLRVDAHVPVRADGKLAAVGGVGVKRQSARRRRAAQFRRSAVSADRHGARVDRGGRRGVRGSRRRVEGFPSDGGGGPPGGTRRWSPPQRHGAAVAHRARWRRTAGIAARPGHARARRGGRGAGESTGRPIARDARGGARSEVPAGSNPSAARADISARVGVTNSRTLGRASGFGSSPRTSGLCRIKKSSRQTA